QDQMAAVMAAAGSMAGGGGSKVRGGGSVSGGAGSVSGGAGSVSGGAGSVSGGTGAAGGSGGGGRSSGRGAETGLASRDAAIMELLYATGIRVSELCGLDVDDLDEGRNTVRVLGKGGRERAVPVGQPAVRAVAAWRRAGRPALARPGSGPALFLGARGGRLDPRTARRVVHARLAAGDGVPESGPHGLRHAAATHLLEGGAALTSGAEDLCPGPPAGTADHHHLPGGGPAGDH